MDIEDEQDFDKNQSTTESKELQLSIQSFSNHSNTSGKRKYVKKTMQVFKDRAEMEDENINLEKSCAIQIFPMYEQLKEQLEFILIGGDFIYNKQDLKLLNADVFFKQREYSHDRIEEQFKQYKDVVSIYRNNNFMDVSLVNKRSGLIDFRNIISQINDTMSFVSGENHLELLLQFQEILTQSHQAILHVISLYPNPQELIELQHKRLTYIQGYSKNYVKENYNDDDFLILGLTMLDFQRQVPCLTNLAFNQAIVSLIGSNFEQLQAYFMRKGVKEFFDFKTRVLIQSHHIRELVKTSGRVIVKQPFNLITYDDIKILCRIELESIEVDLPEELKYDKNSGDAIERHELGFVMKIALDPDQIQHIINLRSKNMDNTDLVRKEEDICYNMQSQYLIEKFYSSELKTLIKDKNFNYFSMDKTEDEEEEENSKEDPQSDQRCKYRFI